MIKGVEFVFSDYFFCGCTRLHMLVGGPEVGVWDHLGTHVYTCLWGPEVGVSIILSGSPLYSWRWIPQLSLEFADMASFTSHFGWGECWRRPLPLSQDLSSRWVATPTSYLVSGGWNYGLTFAGKRSSHRAAFPALQLPYWPCNPPSVIHLL